MTGFGRAEGQVNDRKVTVELRSLNSKQLDLNVRLPMAYRDKEAELRQRLSDRVQRGKADMYVGFAQEGPARTMRFDRERVKAYYHEIKSLAEDVAPGTSTDLLSLVLRLPDVTAEAESTVSEAEWEQVNALVEQACAAFATFRATEGRKLQDDLAARVKAIGNLLAEAATLGPGRIQRTRERLRARLDELAQQVDPDRFEQELVFYLEKLDFTEEQVRLQAHLGYFMETLTSGGASGRKLGFIAQEMGREINTLGSKANDAAIQRVVVQMKDELEKVKEQLLNVL
ncbi:MAG: YicC family protein [Flavobacteriales bacterium]|nr:YicC family protein [Flavobacteriales bacterium]